MFTRTRFLAMGCVMAMAIAGTSDSAASYLRAKPVPSNVHQAVAQVVRNNPSKLITVILNTSPELSEAELIRHGARITHRWSFINSMAVLVPAGNVPVLAAAHGVRGVLPDNPVTSAGKPVSGGGGGGTTGAVNDANLVNAYNYSVRADKVWFKGFNGTGITVAVVDSGISVPSSSAGDFGSRLLDSVKFNPSALYASDKYGHGTHVAGIIAGDGKMSTGKYIGIAPGANILNVKFSDDAGTATERDLVSALQWVYDNRVKYNIRVVNISSTVNTQQRYTDSPTNAAVEQLWFAGVVVVVSVGNRGGETCSVCYAPANDPYVISVGAVDDAGTKATEDDYMKSWSSYGITLDKHFKPDVVAPGARIASYMPSGDLRASGRKNVVDTYYFRMGGTSMAAPVVSGVVALMLQAQPNLTPDQVKWLLMNTTRPYAQQRAGTPGIVAADNATFWIYSIGTANQGLTPSPFLDASTGTMNYSNAYWSNAYWSNAYWSNSLVY